MATAHYSVLGLIVITAMAVMAVPSGGAGVLDVSTTINSTATPTVTTASTATATPTVTPEANDSIRYNGTDLEIFFTDSHVMSNRTTVFIYNIENVDDRPINIEVTLRYAHDGQYMDSAVHRVKLMPGETTMIRQDFPVNGEGYHDIVLTGPGIYHHQEILIDDHGGHDH